MSQYNINARNKKRGRMNRSNKSIVSRILIALLTFCILFLLLTITAAPRKHNIVVGEIAEESIKAPREIEDEYTTGKLRAEARNSITNRYKQDDSITVKVLNSLDDCFAAMEQVRQMGLEEKLRQQQEAGSNDVNIIYSIDFIEEAKEVLPSDFSEGDIKQILDMDKDELNELTNTIRSLIHDAMEGGIKENVLDEQVTNLNQQLISPVRGFSDRAKNLGMNIISIYLKANFIYDAAATEAAKSQAAENVEPLIYKAGQIIVEEGKPVTESQYEILRQLGMVDVDSSIWFEYISIIILLLVLFVVAGWYMALFQRKTINSPKLLLVICSVSVLTLLINLGTSYIHYYIVPIPLAAIIIALIMIDRGVALFINIVLAVLAGIMALRFGDSVALPVTIAALLSGFISVFTIRRIPQRATLMLSGVVAGLVSAAVYVAFDLLNYIGWMDMLMNAGMGLVSGLVASILAIGTMPMWEWLFKLVTPMKLLELTNPNQPLLKQLLMEAPGTYHHSIMVGNMAERAAEAIGASPLIVRAGAYYHDIGKLKRPYFFKENQTGTDNPHDNIQPDLSTRIITSHVNDGLDMVKRQKLPKIIQDIVAEHHGDTPVMYFYMKERNQSKDPDKVNLDDYRYRGMRPHTRESAIILLADSVEAAVRSLDNPTAQSVDEMIRKIIKSKLDDGQLSYCDITLKELNTVTEAFKAALTGVFHERIEYPERDQS